MKISKKWLLKIVLNENDGNGSYKIITENFKTKEDLTTYVLSLKNNPKVLTFSIQKIITYGKKTFYCNGNVKSF